MIQTKTKPKRADSDIEYKFNINERLMKKNELTRIKIQEAVAKEAKRSVPTVRRYRYIQQDETVTINHAILKAFAKHLNVTIEDLENPKTS